MEERKKYEFLVFLTIYVTFIFLMLPVGLKAPNIIIGILEQRYGPAVRTTSSAGAETAPAPSSRYAVPLAMILGAGVLSAATYGGLRAYRKITRRDYRIMRQGRAECRGALAQRPRCRHYRPTPSTECAYFLGSGDQGLCVRSDRGKRAPPRAGRSTAA